MKKLITALLSLVMVMCLSAMAWATGTPAAPSENDIKNLARVTVNCLEDVDAEPPVAGRHGSRSYQLIPGTYSTEGAAVTFDEEARAYVYIFSLTEYGYEAYVAQFEEDMKSEHTSCRSNYQTDKIKLVYNGQWQLADGGAATVKLGRCNTIDKPAAPTQAEITAKGKVNLICMKDGVTHTDLLLPLTAGSYYAKTSRVYWDYTYTVDGATGAWLYKVYLNTPAQGGDGVSSYVEQFNQKYGKHLVEYVHGEVRFIYRYDAATHTGQWEPLDEYYNDFTEAWEPVANYSAAYVEVLCAPTAADLGLNVNVTCKDGTHAGKKYDTANLLADTSLNFEPKFKAYGSDYPYIGHYQYIVSLTDAAANGYVSNYGTAVGKTHKLHENKDSVKIYWGSNASANSLDSVKNPSAAIAVYSDPPAEIPAFSWKLDGGKDTLTVTATDSTTTTPPGGTGGGFPTKKTETTTVPSAKTFDGGVALYAGLGILSMTGSAVVIRRKKEF